VRVSGGFGVVLDKLASLFLVFSESHFRALFSAGIVHVRFRFMIAF
jgi:hypothetical protein